MPVNNLNAEDLGQFTGSEQWYRHSRFVQSHTRMAPNTLPITAERTGCWMRSH
jgi:hypothetical protein